MPCWGVTLGYARNLTLEFGEPHLDIREPKIVDEHRSRQVRDLFARRQVFVRGAWSLWITSVHWAIYLHGDLKARVSSSQRQITETIAWLDGQALVAIEPDDRRGRHTFTFDLGASLVIRRHNGESESWHVHSPDGQVLTAREDGRYSYGPGDRSPKREEWLGPYAHEV